MIALSIALAAASAALSAWSLWSQRKLRKRLGRLEISAVAEVMEKPNPHALEELLETQERLYRHGGFLASEALRQARRLHGLPE